MYIRISSIVCQYNRRKIENQYGSSGFQDFALFCLIFLIIYCFRCFLFFAVCLDLFDGFIQIAKLFPGKISAADAKGDGNTGAAYALNQSDWYNKKDTL